MIVIPENLIRGARVKYGQLMDVANDIFQLYRRSLLSPLCFEPFESFFQRFLNRSCQRVPSLSGNFSRQAFHFKTLDIQGHNCIIVARSMHVYTDVIDLKNYPVVPRQGRCMIPLHC